MEDEGIRVKLRKQLEQSGMGSAVRKIVRQICNSKDNVDEINPDDVVDEVYKRGLITGLMDNLDKYSDNKGKRSDAAFMGLRETRKNSTLGDWRNRYEDQGSEEDSSEEDAVDKALRKSGKYYLKVEVKGGKSFLDHILHDCCDLKNDELHGSHEVGSGSQSKLKLHIFYKSQRFSSNEVKCCRDPAFNEVFLIEIGRFNNGDGSTRIATKLLSINSPLRIMIVREDINCTNSVGGSLVAYCLYDWRSILMTENGVKSFPLELMGIGPQHNICVGILQLRCSLIPTPHEKLTEPMYLDKVNDEKATQEDFDRSFVAEAKRWWREYMEIRAEHQLRLIRIFAYDEKMTARPVMTFVKLVVLDDLLVTPFQAAWFVSLMPLNESQKDVISSSKEIDEFGGPIIKEKSKDWILPGIQNGIGGCLLSERWQNLDATIISKSGTVEDHAVLLTSLLITFGLDAYVALGTKKGKGSWAWSITMSENQEPTFWESTTGEYYEHYSCPEEVMNSYGQLPSNVLKRLAKNKMYNFLTVSCLFNNKGLYANVQPTTSVGHLDWNLTSPSKWKHLPLIENVEVLPCPVRISPSVVNWDFVSKKMEFMLRNLVCLARKERGMGTKWDEHFEQYMGQHLVREELESSTSGNNFKDYFRTVAHLSLPPGHDFRAQSFHSRTSDSHSLFDRAMRQPLMQGIILQRGDDVRHSLQMKIFPYPEDVVSIRLIISCKYIPTV